ncbi:aliphatic sulfonate ABC transporter substrate-binding protein [Niallia nealsonii]|uniref:Putative aliphatic sulfonates-binding protein n=1 Tax=Niallia nealsonii TaxID=115979 RepID=A0A2N0Z0B6_9BACI|nr:aliphatic sulfonate ABC transporter substrate-binding protein [Niallia nealsonii]PKG22928.1 aliphatic sulfonates ABC transporter substrate-binding protein [Niallia nealsonii]
MKNFWYSIFTILIAGILLTGCASSETNGESNDNKDEVVVTIGIQGSGGVFGKAREEKWFEEEFAKKGAKVEWKEFQSGPPMTEAMASNKLDFALLGNMPIIAAQAANIPFTVISQTIDGKNNVGIILPKDSKITSIKELKGKKIAVVKGSNAFNFLYRGLDEAGIDVADTEIIQLQPDEAQAAFESGGVDAWATWDPYISLNVLTDKAKVLVDGEQLGILSPSFQIVRTEFAKKHPDLVTLYLEVFNKALDWEQQNKDEAIERYAKERNTPTNVIEGTLDRGLIINIPVSDEIMEEQQKTADFQYSLKTIRQKIDVKEVFDNQYIEEALK